MPAAPLTPRGDVARTRCVCARGGTTAPRVGRAGGAGEREPAPPGAAACACVAERLRTNGAARRLAGPGDTARRNGVAIGGGAPVVVAARARGATGGGCRRATGGGGERARRGGGGERGGERGGEWRGGECGGDNARRVIGGLREAAATCDARLLLLLLLFADQLDGRLVDKPSDGRRPTWMADAGAA